MHLFRCASVVAILACAAVAHAESKDTKASKDCLGYGTLSDDPQVDSARVAGPGRTFFVKSESDDKACPAATATCRRKAFLVASNSVLVSDRAGAFVCATFVNPKGVETSGWLPAAAVALDKAAPAIARDDWAGTWEREEAEIKIKPDGTAAVSIEGDATYGAGDPDRVKRGAVNMGSIAAKLAPAGDKLSFAMGDDDKVLPVEKGDDTTCKVWMRRAGAYLLVDDNNNCGGYNVSFRGTYARR